MNNKRRAKLKKIIDKIKGLVFPIDTDDVNDVQNLASELYDDVEDLYSEESDSYDNLPESLQDSERGEAMQDAMDELDNAMSELATLVDELAAAEDGNADWDACRKAANSAVDAISLPRFS